MKENMRMSFENALQQICSTYGSLSNAALMIRLEYLAFLLQEEIIDERCNSLIQAIRQQYRTGKIDMGVEDPDIKVCKNGDEVIYTFSREAFDKEIQLFGKRSVEIITIHREVDFDLLDDRRWYLFIVNPDNEIVIGNDAMNTCDLIVNRKTKGNETPLIHTLLAERSSLSVKSAGELMPIKKNGVLKAIIFNTKSGHYRPSPETIKIVSKIFRDIVPQCIIVAIPVGLKPFAI